MKKKATNLTLTFLIFLVAFCTKAQSLAWESDMGGQQEDYGNALCRDGNGNIIVTGSFNQICYGDNFALSSYGNSDIFLQKLSPQGAVLWTKQYGYVNSDNSFSVVADSAGNIYLTGVFLGTVNFGGGNLSSTNIDPKYFLLKLDPDGNVLWRRTIRGGSTTRPKLALDANDNLFMTGIMVSTSAYDSFTLNPLNGEIFVLKINSETSSIVWAQQFGSTTVRSSSSSIAVDQLGNIVVAGSFMKPGIFGSTVIPATEFSERNGFTLKLNENGEILWFKRIEGYSQNTGIAVDTNNDIYTAGNYRGPTTIDGVAYNTSTPNNFSVYFQKMDATGNQLWIKNYDINTTEPPYTLPILTTNTQNLVFLRLLFRNSISFENQNFTEVISGLYKPTLFSCFYPNGTLAWVKQSENPSDNTGFGNMQDRGQSIIADETGLYFTCGNVVFDGIRYNQQSGANVFTAKLNLPELKTSIFDQAPVIVTPNPSEGEIHLTFGADTVEAKIQVVDVLGQTIAAYQCFDRSYSFNLNAPSGVYLIRIVTAKGTFTQKMILK